ncbi:MAG: SpoIIE family protein phosphatase [Spirochaetaceae bacterium]
MVVYTLLLAGFLFLQPPVLFAQQLYWEEPEVFVPSNARFPSTAEGGDTSVILWHEFQRSDGEVESVSLSLAVKTPEMEEWTLYEDVIGPYDYTGQMVSIASLAVTGEGEIFIAAAGTGRRIDIYTYEEEEDEFSQIGTAGKEGDTEITVAPRLFAKDDGGLLLFVTSPFGVSDFTQIGAGSLGISYSSSSDGREWKDFLPLVRDSELSYIYLPHHVSYEGKEYVVFQASPSDSRFFQLYSVESDDGGMSWSKPERISDFKETQIDDDEDPNNYDNQRPHLRINDGSIYLAWERRYAGNTPPQVYFLENENPGEWEGEPENVTDSSNNCRDPQSLVVDDTVYLVWFDDRKGENRIFVAHRQGASWQDQDVSIMRGTSAFPKPLQLEGEIHLVWENAFREDYRLVFLEPDKSVSSPSVSPLNFKSGEKAGQDVFRISWNLPDDSSGIAGFNYTVDRDPEGKPEQSMEILRGQDRVAGAEVEEDGSWYFHVIARDYAGNWSDPATVEFIRDTTPPPPVSFREHETNEEGFFPSNTATIEWDPPEEDDIEGYTYRLQYLAGQHYEGSLESFDLKDPPERVITRDNEFSFRNMDNGLWALTVRPVDTVGNIGPAETYYFRLNNYIPVTYITRIQMEKDELNRYHMDIYGRGFAESGDVTQVMLDRDGEEPYDFVFPAGADSYEVETDRHISGPTIEDIDEGSYKVGLVHPKRGVYFTGYTLTFESTGTVKFGDFRILTGEKDELQRRDLHILSVGNITFAIVMLLLAVLLIFTVFKVSAVTKEGYDLQLEVKALIHNTALPSEKKKERLKTMKKQGVGLRIKFALLVTFLVLIIVLIVALPLGRYMIETQQRDLTQGLQESTRVLIESIDTGARKFLPEENTIELGRLPSQISAAEDARFVTITGPPSGDIQVEEKGARNYLWASNNSDIENKIVRSEGVEKNSEGEIQFDRGEVQLEDEISKNAQEMKERINREAEENLGDLSARLEELQQQASEAAEQMARSDDQDTAQLLNELQDEISRLSRRIDEELLEIGDMMGSSPEFVAEEILTGPEEYIFYRPIVYEETDSESKYFQGMVRLGISTERIRKEITASRDTLIRQTGLIALGAIGIGIIGALILATIIISPIKRLVSGVEKIRDTDDMSNFNERIKIKSRDEISILADTINEMTEGLVKAEVARKDLIFGKETQKRFIPLEESGKEKLTTGKKVTEYAEFFGYYEGAKGVSGDYFDYLEYDAEKYAIIKCDVAGKGIPASLIMVEVATIFHSFFNDYMEGLERKRKIAEAKNKKITPENPDISKLVLGINRLVQERGFEGKFAALVVALVDAKTGATVFTNAGDSLVHIYNKEKKEVETKELKKAPAAGVFDNEMIEMQGGFIKEPHMLKRGDAILFYTDGIEEGKRHFRDKNFQPMVCQEPGLEQNQEHGGTHLVGADNEEFTNERIYDIVRAVFTKGSYRLYKYHNPLGEEDLEFDFSSCEGTIEEVVIALISVEKIFRVYPHPEAGDRDLIRVDAPVHDFLKNHFLQYHAYFTHPVEQEHQEQYYVFSRLREDEQYDDLTIIGLYRK